MQDFFSKMQQKQGGAQPQGQQGPSLDALMGGGQMAAPQQSAIDMNQAKGPAQQEGEQAAVISMKIEAALQQMGYYELEENQGRGIEIQKEITELVEAIMNDDAEVLKNSEIYAFITSRKGQRESMREPAATMPNLGGMVDGGQ